MTFSTPSKDSLGTLKTFLPIRLRTQKHKVRTEWSAHFNNNPKTDNAVAFDCALNPRE
jgi:hypothetical protein